MQRKSFRNPKLLRGLLTGSTTEGNFHSIFNLQKSISLALQCLFVTKFVLMEWESLPVAGLVLKAEVGLGTTIGIGYSGK